MKVKEFTRDDTNLIKGIAILCIILHNLLHWIDPSPGENEFVFYPMAIQNFIRLVGEQPSEIINLIFSFFGHFGVQIFIFISGYGLAVSFSKKRQSWGRFVIDRLNKLYPLLLTGIIFVIFSKLLIDKHFLQGEELYELGLKMLFAHTLCPDSGLSICGPWWFFALIFQLYLLFPLLFALIRKSNTKGMLAVMLVSYVWIYLSQYAYHGDWNVLLLQNAPGHLPEFVFGIWYALNKDKKISNIIAIMALPVFVLGCFYKAFFPLTFLAITILSVWMMTPFVAKQGKGNWLRRFLVYYGSISMFLFAVHGSFRTPFVDMANRAGSFEMTFVITVLFVVFATAMAVAAKSVYEFLHFKNASKTFNRIMQVFLILLAFHFVFRYNIKPDYVKNHLTIYENHFSIEPADAELFMNIIEEDGNYAVKMDGNEYMALMPYPILEHEYATLQAELSFDLFSEVEDEDSLPLVVFACEKDETSILWKSEKLKPVAAADGWRHVEIVTELKLTENPTGARLKVYLWNKNRQVMKLDNIAVNIHY